MLGDVVAGEQAPFCVAVIGVIGRLVLGIEVAPVASGMAIQQTDDQVMGQASGNRGNPAQIFGELLTLLEAVKRTPL